ncbi:hypothetical protein NMD99_03540 [Wolbachia endosymbiont of Listronotus oregonensis]|nr:MULTISPECIES: hypothetical protein [unclassified Wolbachia]MDX5496042.1 hypothetical protein [Wolbachia endosymbiont of Nomada marshamella]WMT85048.1 hypothetical protein NMD99_03540 [Wolbachia endosymbiont of Listronotus oregonensis]
MNKSRYDGSWRYDVEAILLYSPTQYPIWIQVVSYLNDKKGVLG